MTFEYWPVQSKRSRWSPRILCSGGSLWVVKNKDTIAAGTPCAPLQTIHMSRRLRSKTATAKMKTQRISTAAVFKNVLRLTQAFSSRLHFSFPFYASRIGMKMAVLRNPYFVSTKPSIESWFPDCSADFKVVLRLHQHFIVHWLLMNSTFFSRLA